jgi:uncharacterized protein
MKWEGNRQSDNVEDRRGSPGGGGGGVRLGGRGVGLGTIVIALVAGWIFGINPLTVLFVSTVLADTEDVWGPLFKSGGSQYREPKLVLFRGRTPTACGTGDAAMGPFYCPGDEKVYIDLAFFDTLKQRLGAPGDFAQAYVIAHEVGHHVQKVLGISDKVDTARQRMNEAQGNALSVRLELQADCFAGVWAHHAQRARQLLEQGDLEEALNAASQIGDDNLQRKSQGTVVPESFTHGSSAQRVAWFKRGLQGGQVRECNTFEARQL